jgi:hypothetical protein
MALRPTELLNLRRHDLRCLRFTTLMRYGVTSYGFMIYDFTIYGVMVRRGMELSDMAL